MLADKDIKSKKLAIKKAKMKKKVNCPKGTTPHLDPNANGIRYVCKPIDKTKSMLMKKIQKTMSVSKKKLKIKKALATKDFRYGSGK